MEHVDERQVEGKNGKGRSRMRYTDQLMENVKQKNLSVSVAAGILLAYHTEGRESDSLPDRSTQSRA